MYTDFEESLSSPVLSSCSSSSGWTRVGLEESRSKDAPHPLSLRPWDITVLINLHKVHGRLPTVSTTSQETSNFIHRRFPDIIVKWAYLQLWLWDYSCDALALIFPLGIKSVVVNLVCTLVCSTAAVTAQRVLQASWSVCVLRWRRVIRRPCYSSFSRLYMCLSAITIRWEWEEVTLFIFSEVLIFKVVMFLYWVIYSHLCV